MSYRSSGARTVHPMSLRLGSSTMTCLTARISRYALPPWHQGSFSHTIVFVSPVVIRPSGFVPHVSQSTPCLPHGVSTVPCPLRWPIARPAPYPTGCLLYTSDAADERSSVDLGGR